MEANATARQTRSLPEGRELEELLLRKLGPGAVTEIETQAEALVAVRYEMCPSCGGWREKGRPPCGS